MRELRLIFACIVVCVLVTTALQPTYAQDSVGVWSQNLTNSTRVYTMDISASNGNLIYCAGLDSGVYKTTNGGVSWTPVNTGLTYNHVQAIAMSRSNNSILYCGTDQLGTTNSGVYKTTDGGATWTFASTGILESSRGIQAIVIHPTNPNIAWMSVFDGLVNSTTGLYKTTDGGANWVPSNAGIGTIKNILAIAVNPLNPNTLYCGTSFSVVAPALRSRIYRSVDGGANWVDVSNGLPTDTTIGHPIRALSISSSDTNVILAALFLASDTLGGAYVTTDGGATWVRKHTGLQSINGALLRACLIKPGSSTEFYVGLDGGTTTARGVWRTTNGGASWSDFNNGTMVNTYTIRSLVFKTQGNPTLYAGAANAAVAVAGRGVYEYSWTAPPQPLILAANPGPTNNGGSPNWAMFFNLIGGTRRVRIDSMTTASQAAANASFSIVFFKRVGNALGGPVGSGPGSSTAGWDSLGTVPVTQGSVGSGVSLPFAIPPIFVNPAETVGVAMRFLVSGPRYYGTGTPPLETYSDANLTLVTGDVRSNPFNPTGSFFTSRALVGDVRYSFSSAGPTCNTFARTWAPTGRYPDLPAPVYFQAAAWIGDSLFVQAPTSTGAGATTVYKYVRGGGWTTGVGIPAAKVGGTLTNCANKLYYIGGGTTSITTGTTDVYEFNPATQAWTTKAAMPAALSAHGAVCWGDSVIFVIGGPYTGSGTNLNVYVYRPASDTWSTISGSLPTGQGRRSFASGISGNKIVISSGFNTAFLKSTFVGTINSAASITWAAAPDVPTVYTGLSRPGGTAFGDKFFLVCGERGGPGGYYDTTHVFSISGNAWTAIINNKPIKMSNIFSAVTAKCINDTVKIFVPGGYGNATGSGTGVASPVFDVIDAGSLVGVSEPVAEVPGEFRLEQNYPNPFNPTTTIQYGLPAAANVTLKIYNILGQEIITLVSEQKSPGTYQAMWNSRNSAGAPVASGVYFYSLVAKSANDATTYTNIKKMLFLK